MPEPGQDHVATVQEIYAAFGRGDIPAILAHLAEDVRWEEWEDNHAQRAGVPWLESRRGRDSVPGFFEQAGALNIIGFEVLSIFGSGSTVGAEIRLTTDPGPGAGFSDEELHLWTFGDDGLVTRFRHYVDTAKHVAAARALRGAPVSQR